jgi:AraC-like DNA-binding protein
VGWLNGVFDVVPQDLPRNGFCAEAQSWQIGGGCLFSRVRTPAIRVERSVADIRRNPLDHWVIALGRYATSVISSGETTLTALPGTPFALSFANELTSERPDDERLQLFRPSRASAGPGVRILPDVGPDDLPRLSDAIGAMVAACLASQQDREGVAAPQIDLIRLERVRQVVRRYLQSSALGPRLLCRSLSMSRSNLYRVMESEGGMARYIQRQRLLEAYKLLSDQSEKRSIDTIANDLCFADTAGFSRAFRREFGASPRDVRAVSRTAPKLGVTAAHAKEPLNKGRLGCTWVAS